MIDVIESGSDSNATEAELLGACGGQVNSIEPSITGLPSIKESNANPDTPKFVSGSLAHSAGVSNSLDVRVGNKSSNGDSGYDSGLYVISNSEISNSGSLPTTVPFEKREVQNGVKSMSNNSEKAKLSADMSAPKKDHLLCSQSLNLTDPKVQKLTQEHKKLKENSICNKCQNNKIDILFLPCRHMVACTKCSSTMDNCVKCSKKIIGQLRFL